MGSPPPRPLPESWSEPALSPPARPSLWLPCDPDAASARRCPSRPQSNALDWLLADWPELGALQDKPNGRRERGSEDLDPCWVGVVAEPGPGGVLMFSLAARVVVVVVVGVVVMVCAGEGIPVQVGSLCFISSRVFSSSSGAKSLSTMNNSLSLSIDSLSSDPRTSIGRFLGLEIGKVTLAAVLAAKARAWGFMWRARRRFQCDC